MVNNIATRSTLTWLLQRITAIFLVVFLFTHINFNHLITWEIGEHGWRGLIDFQFVQSRLQAGSVFWTVFYVLFIPSAAFHAMNGLWGIFADYRPTDKLAKFVQAVLILIGLALVYFGAATMFNLFKLATGGSHGI